MDEDIEFLKRLKKMREENLITEEEYKEKRDEYLHLYAPGLRPVSKSRVIYIVSGILLGSWGIHNFYIGSWGLGCMKLILCFLFFIYSDDPLMVNYSDFIYTFLFIWIISELIFIKKDAKGMPLKW